MTFLYFPGCRIPHHLPQYGRSVLALCDVLGISLEYPEFGCCGWPVRHESYEASMYSAVRNLAIAEQAGLPVMTPCKCCFGNLKHARAAIHSNESLRTFCAEKLAREKLPFPESTEVVHLLTVLDRYVGTAAITGNVTHSLDGLKVACHYGCHALRPAEVTDFDDPLAPTVFERVVAATGAEPVHWDLRLECCGHPLRGRDETISGALMRRKLESVRDSGAHVLATACTYCQLQFDEERIHLPAQDPLLTAPPALLVTQLLGLATGLGGGDLGLDKNRFLQTYLSY
ncbi:MAG TPA: CoB--CoM heterodisulfide reductase iron-sulfur subunit B family protein [Desulfomicrobiaceae bacterium]|nr:CoB--CoM heterodisulfide reductase iron-sulfur subunit B family protein [Desulfomicrobiaceae bacterium]